jgi:hypothetical protein
MMVLDPGYKALPLVSILSKMSVVHTTSSYYPYIYSHIFPMVYHLEILPQEICMHFFFLPWVPYASLIPIHLHVITQIIFSME